MSRHVVRCIGRPCVTAQWRILLPQSTSKRWISSLDELSDFEVREKTPAQRKEEQIILLQKQDQQHLSEAKRNVEEVIKIIEEAQKDVAALQTTVQILPEIPTYTLGYPRHVYQRLFPEAAKNATDAAKHVREHLIDLKHQPYEDSSDNSLAREIAKLSEEEKQERYKKKKDDADAMKVRIQRKAEEDIKTVLATIERHTTKKGQPIHSFATTATTKDDADGAIFKDLTEPVKTEGKKAEDWGRSARLDETKEVESAGWADAGSIPIRRTWRPPEPHVEKQDAGDDDAEVTEVWADGRGAKEDISVPVQESGFEVKLVDDEVKDAGRHISKTNSLEDLKNRLNETISGGKK